MSEWSRHWERRIRLPRGRRLRSSYFGGTHGWFIQFGWTNENAKPRGKGRFFE